MASNQTQIELGEKFFKYRDYTPIPLIIILLVFAKPSVFSATIGLLLVVLGELIRVYSVAFIGSISRTRKDNTGSNLITTGPFSYVRNPLYVGNFFISFGLAVFGGHFGVMILAVALFATQYYFIVKYEESILTERFGPAYERYCEEVPAWVPAKLPSVDELEWPTTFTPALRSERRTLTAIAAMLLVLVLVA